MSLLTKRENAAERLLTALTWIFRSAADDHCRTTRKTLCPATIRTFPRILKEKPQSSVEALRMSAFRAIASFWALVN